MTEQQEDRRRRRRRGHRRRRGRDRGRRGGWRRRRRRGPGRRRSAATPCRRPSEAALAETGGGRVTGTEVGDEESYYEVEVTLDDGSQVDVQLDENFAVVGSEADVEDSDEGGD